MKTKNGFTLIELLAVIVILAIIALIATPIVLNIISESKESSQLQSAQFYLDAVEYTIADAVLNHGGLENGKYPITKDGDICKKALPCDDANTLKVEVKGEKPTSGYINIEAGKIGNLELEYNNKKITKNNEGKLVYGEASKLLYTIGEEVTFDPGDGDKTWNVIGEDNDTVTLLLSQNLGNTVEWYAYSNHNSSDNSYGPKDVLEYLNSLTTGWSNVDPISSYNYVNNLNGTSKPNGYQKIEIINGVTTLKHKDGTTTKLNETKKAKARLLTLEEVLEIAVKVNPNLTETNLRGYIEKYLDTIQVTEGFEEVATITNKEDKIDKVIELMLDGEYSSYSNHFQTYITVIWLSDCIEVDYLRYDEENDKYEGEVLLDFLYQNLNGDEGPYGYWTLSSDAGSSSYAWVVDCGGLVSHLDAVDCGGSYGVRPVITVSKSKL